MFTYIWREANTDNLGNTTESALQRAYQLGQLDGARKGLDAAYKEVSENQKAFGKDSYAKGNPSAFYSKPWQKLPPAVYIAF